MAEHVSFERLSRSSRGKLVLITKVRGYDLRFSVQINYKALIRFSGNSMGVDAVEAEIAEVLPKTMGDVGMVRKYLGDGWEDRIKGQAKRNMGFGMVVGTFISRNSQVIQDG